MKTLHLLPRIADAALKRWEDNHPDYLSLVQGIAAKWVDFKSGVSTTVEVVLVTDDGKVWTYKYSADHFALSGFNELREV